MSTSTSSYLNDLPEAKQLEYSEYKSKDSKDDMKMQQHVHMKEIKSILDPTLPEKPIDSKETDSTDDAVDDDQSLKTKSTESSPVSTEGTSLVDGVTNAVSQALGKVNELLPTSVSDKTAQLTQAAVELGSNLQDRAINAVHTITNMPSTISQGITDTAANINTTFYNKASELALAAATIQDKALHNSIVDSYEDGGVIAAAKTSLKVGSKAASNMTKAVKQQVSSTSAKLMGKSTEVKQHYRRRRGGRNHGNRKYKTKLVNVPQQESILDTLGEKAKEIQEVIVEPVESKSSSNEKKGVIRQVREGTSNMIAGVSSTVTGVIQSATNAASSATQTITNKVSDLTNRGNVKEKNNALPPRPSNAKKKKLSGNNSNSSSRATSPVATTAASAPKPSLDRRAELPSLGTPNTPDSDVFTTPSGSMAVNVKDQSSMMDKAKFAIGAAKDYVVDKIDNMSLNADDDSPLEERQEEGKPKVSKSSTEKTLEKATKSMKQMKQKVAEKIDDGSSTTGTPKTE